MKVNGLIEMASDISREDFILIILRDEFFWQQEHDWLIEIVAKSGWFNWKSELLSSNDYE